MNEPILKLENQVVSYELALKLKELGVNQTSLFYHHNGKILTWWEMRGRTVSEENEPVAAHTVAELFELFPKGTPIEVFNHSLEYQVLPVRTQFKHIACQQSLANAMADQIIHCLENNLITLPL